MTPFVIIADDLSGAGDAGVQFAKRGFATDVLIDPGAPVDPEASVAVYDTDSRVLAPRDAAARVAAILAHLRPDENRRVFKKIDSTLRGAIGAEIGACLDALPGAFAILTPAYPANGRTSREGQLYVRGRPVHETDIGRDPKTPVRTSSIREIAGEPAAVVGLETVRGGAPGLREAVDGARRSGATRIIIDAETDDDLSLGASLYDAFPDAVWVGSAGILDALRPELGPPGPPRHIPRFTTPLLAVAGSMSETTREQIVRFEQAGAVVATLEPSDLCASPWGASIQVAAGTIAARFREGRPVALIIGDDGSRDEERAPVLAERLGALTARLVRELGAEVIFLTGGDTARAACVALGIERLSIVDELEPGIPLSRAGDRYLITKAGGFGRPDALSRIDARIHGERVS